MDQKTKVFLNGQIYEATKVPIRNSNEKWTEVLLEDGSVIKMKIIVVEAARIDGLYEPDGTPVYNVKSNQVMAVSSPEDIKKIQGGK